MGLGAGQGKEQGRGVRTDVEIVSSSSEVGGLQGLGRLARESLEKGLRRVSRASWGSGDEGATLFTGPETYFSSIRCCTN